MIKLFVEGSEEVIYAGNVFLPTKDFLYCKDNTGMLWIKFPPVPSIDNKWKELVHFHVAHLQFLHFQTSLHQKLLHQMLE